MITSENQVAFSSSMPEAQLLPQRAELKCSEYVLLPSHRAFQLHLGTELYSCGLSFFLARQHFPLNFIFPCYIDMDISGTLAYWRCYVLEIMWPLGELFFAY